MKFITAKLAFATQVVFVSFGTVALSHAQAAATVIGTVTDSSGHPVFDASVSAKSAESGRLAAARTDTAGKYAISNLQPGDYEITFAADGLTGHSARITIAAGVSQTLDAVLTPIQQPSSNLPNAPAQNLPNSPSGTTPSLGDLGFTPQQTQANPQLQAMLARRTEMLKVHQRLGLITVIPMAAALITGPSAKAKGRNGQAIKEPTTANLDFHIAVGGATTGLYFATAYYAIFAPRIPNNPKHGAIRMHEGLAFVHVPGMILTPVLGIMAYKQENAGEKVHGIASAHGSVAYITAAAYGASIVAVSWPIHLKFWEKK
jgi:hypothetical protein